MSAFVIYHVHSSLSVVTIATEPVDLIALLATSTGEVEMAYCHVSVVKGTAKKIFLLP
jgi:hypothetical protein